MAINKVFKTLDNQIELIKYRNAKVRYPKKAKKYLLENNYFNMMNGTETLFLKTKNPKKFRRVHINKFYQIINLDRKISKNLFSLIGKIETKLQSIISYRLSSYLASSPPNISDNQKFMDISNYSIPIQGTGPSKYTSCFYNAYQNKKRHAFFKKYSKNNQSFTGTFTGKVSQSDNKYVLDGKFEGSIKNYRQNVYYGKFYTNSNYSVSTTPVSIILRNEFGNFANLNFTDYTKMNNHYVNEYINPPLWVVVKTLKFNDLILLLYGLKTSILMKY